MNVKKTPLPDVPSSELPTLVIGDAAGSTSVTESARSHDGQPPEIIAGYRRQRQLGAGGMGQVYLAEDVRLKRSVALKLLRGAVADEPAFVERFLRESKTMAQVSHPNVVGIHGAGEQGGWLWMALEFVPGNDLNKMLKTRGRFEESEVIRILIACCKGLTAIHAAGLVHRDLKPANIFMGRDGEPKIGDLGLARHADGEDRMTLTGHAWGTPAYMSPEQVQGIADIDIRSDLYALGVVAFILLSGTEPFTGPTSYVVTNLVLTQPAPDIRSRNRSVTAGLAAIIACCLEKDRKKRYATPDALRVDLERLSQSLPLATAALVAPPPSSASSTSAPVSIATASSGGGGGGGGFGHIQGPSNPVLIKLAIYGIGAVVLGGVIWSVQGGTEVERPAKTTAPEPVSVIPGPQAQNLEPWMEQRGRDTHGEWATLRLKGPAVRLRLIPATTFTMGSPVGEVGRSTSETAHPVTITRPYWMTETEVTQELFRRLVPEYIPANAGDERPADQVSWHDISAFLDLLGKQIPGANPRLPSEAEWEHASRAGGEKAFGTEPGLDPREWVDQPADGGSRKVAQGQPNAFGLFDMLGNVREWCRDNWEDKPLPATAVVDPVHEFGARVACRGGSYLLPVQEARCAARHGLDVQDRRPDLGFRFVIPTP